MRTQEQRNTDFDRLRAEVGGDSQFMSAHQIKKRRTALPRYIPEWTQSDEAVRRFLLDRFPLLILGARRDLHTVMLRLSLLPRRQSERGQRQVRRALYTYAVIRLVYRLRLTEKETARDIQFWFPYRGRSLSEETRAIKEVLMTIRQHVSN
jgi:hypothetical protein